MEGLNYLGRISLAHSLLGTGFSWRSPVGLELVSLRLNFKPLENGSLAPVADLVRTQEITPGLAKKVISSPVHLLVAGLQVSQPSYVKVFQETLEKGVACNLFIAILPRKSCELP